MVVTIDGTNKHFPFVQFHDSWKDLSPVDRAVRKVLSIAQNKSEGLLT
jgi:hypothetical protein